MEVHVRNVHVEVVVHEITINILVVMENIVQHEHLVVVHVQINHQTHIIMEIHVEIVVVGHVMHDIIRMEVNVHNVRVEATVQHDQLVLQHVDEENILGHDECLMVLLVQIYLQDVMEQVRVVHVHQHVVYENIVQHEAQVVVQ